MFSYRGRIEKDLPRWESQGWVTAGGARAIRSEVAATGLRFGLPQVLATLAAILLGFGAMLFVASNWQDMSRLARLAVILAGLWAAYGAAALFYARALAGIGHAATLLGVAIFGAGIMLIAQMYHIEGNPPDAVLVWGAGTLGAAFLLRANPAYALSVILLGLWGGWEAIQREHVFWPLLPGAAVIFAALTISTRWRPAYHMLALVLTGFVVLLGYVKGAGESNELVLLIGLVLMAFFAVLGPSIDRHLAVSRAGIGYAFIVAFAGIHGMQFVDVGWYGFDDTTRLLFHMPLWALALAALALVLGGIWFGALSDNRALMWLGYAGFSAEVLTLYFRTVGSLLDSSLFFLLAGLIVAALAAIAWRLHARIASRTETAS